MPEDKLVEYCMSRHKLMVSQRAPFEADWLDIRTFVRPITVSFNPITGTFQTVRTDVMFDGTAPNALDQLGSALHSLMTNPSDRWFELQIYNGLGNSGTNDVMDDDEVLLWLDQVSDIIYCEYQRTESNFNLAMHECYLDVGSFGTTCLYQGWNVASNGLTFSAKPLQYCYFLENSQGAVDTVHLQCDWTIRQVIQEFGMDTIPPKLKELAMKDQDKMVTVIHCVYPRTERIVGNLLPRNKAFASVWICQSTKETIKELGYDELPYNVARWTKLTGESYGRSPSKKCLPDIKMLNAMERTILKAGQKIVDPPLVLANEGFMLPLRTSPGALIFKEDEERKIEPLITHANLPWAEDKANQKRDFINQCFYSDLIRRAQKKAEQTLGEVEDERSEMLQLMAPMLGRLSTELHGPMIARSYGLLLSHGRLPTSPGKLKGKKLTINYISAAAMAQRATKATAISRYMADLTPLAQINPGIFDNIDFDEAAAVFAKARGVPRSLIRSSDAVAQIRNSKAQMQSAQQLAQTAEPASKAMKNIADAQKSGLSIPGGGM